MISYILGIILMILSKAVNSFGICIIGVVFIGCGCALGDAVNLGFMKGFPPILVGNYCGGVGFSACLGSVIYFILKVKGVSFELIFICMVF